MLPLLTVLVLVLVVLVLCSTAATAALVVHIFSVCGTQTHPYFVPKHLVLAWRRREVLREPRLAVC